MRTLINHRVQGVALRKVHRRGALQVAHVQNGPVNREAKARQRRQLKRRKRNREQQVVPIGEGLGKSGGDASGRQAAIGRFGHDEVTTEDQFGIQLHVLVAVAVHPHEGSPDWMVPDRMVPGWTAPNWMVPDRMAPGWMVGGAASADPFQNNLNISVGLVHGKISHQTELRATHNTPGAAELESLSHKGEGLGALGDLNLNVSVELGVGGQQTNGTDSNHVFYSAQGATHPDRKLHRGATVQVADVVLRLPDFFQHASGFGNMLAGSFGELPGAIRSQVVGGSGRGRGSKLVKRALLLRLCLEAGWQRQAKPLVYSQRPNRIHGPGAIQPGAGGIAGPSKGGKKQ